MRTIWIRTDNADARGLVLRDDDLKTSPSVDRGNAVVFRFGCFRKGQPLDLSEFTNFRFEFRDDRLTPAILFSLTAAAADTDLITSVGFNLRSQSNLTLTATGTQTNLHVDAKNGERKLWAHLSALDDNEEEVTLGKGWVTIVEDNNAAGSPVVENPAVKYLLLKLPDDVDPLDLPGIPGPPGPEGPEGPQGVGLTGVELTAEEYYALTLEERSDPTKIYEITDFGE